MFTNLLVINELGYGNGVLALPFLDALASRVCKGTMWHVDNPLLATPKLTEYFRLRNAPGQWAFAKCDDHEAILEFVACERIELFVSLRNEDFTRPSNVGYAQLRERLHERGVVVWDLFERPDETRYQYIAEQWRWLFAQHGVEIDVSVSAKILELFTQGLLREESDERPLGFLLSASRSDKRVAQPIVREIIRSVLKQDVSVRVVSGISSDEVDEAAQLRTSLRDDRVDFVTPPNVAALISTLRGLRAVCCNDTFGMHCAVALGIPTVALFSTTRREIWGPPDSELFRGISSRLCAICPKMPTQGYCIPTSSSCAGVPNESFDATEIVDQVLRFALPLVKGQASRR
jgi:hypothetical protein